MNDALTVAHERMLDLAVAALRGCDHDRRYGHSGCPQCQRLAWAVEWLAAYRELHRDAAHLLRTMYDLTAHEPL